MVILLEMFDSPGCSRAELPVNFPHTVPQPRECRLGFRNLQPFLMLFSKADQISAEN
jgi:hypothetical protein